MTLWGKIGLAALLRVVAICDDLERLRQRPGRGFVFEHHVGVGPGLGAQSLRPVTEGCVVVRFLSQSNIGEPCRLRWCGRRVFSFIVYDPGHASLRQVFVDDGGVPRLMTELDGGRPTVRQQLQEPRQTVGVRSEVRWELEQDAAESVSEFE